MSDMDVRNQATPHRRQRAALISWFMLILVVVIAVGYWFATQGPSQRIVSPPGSDVAAFNGDDDQVTDSFTVRGQWQVHWENQGTAFAFVIAGDEDLGTIVDQAESGSGITNVVAAGTFHLEITANGPWSVRITQGE